MINAQFIMIGVVILGVVFVFQVLRFSSAFQVLVTTFVFGWSALVAMHGWGLATHVVASLNLPNVTEGQAALLAYWALFLIAAALAWAPRAFWLQKYSTTFPVLLDRLLHLACVLFMVAAVASLLLMSYRLAMPPADGDEAAAAALAGLPPEPGEPAEPAEPAAGQAQDLLQWTAANGGRIPVQAYLAVTRAVSSAASADARRLRLPAAARRLAEGR